VEKENVRLEFKDFGPGIQEQYLPFIFNRFFRSPDTPNIHGSGLGLYICKQIILAHNGQITVSSEVGKGTAITVHLPRSV
jgi:signal transduction histidine kinase